MGTEKRGRGRRFDPESFNDSIKITKLSKDTRVWLYEEAQRRNTTVSQVVRVMIRTEMFKRGE